MEMKLNYFGDHECDSVVEYYMEDYDKWSYKIVYYVYYNDEGNRFPVFCVEPAKQGVGTGYDSYIATINKVEDMYSNGIEKKNQIWRILMKGYMGSKWSDWDLECDDDFYSSTKIALHSLAENVSPKDKYVLGDRSVDGNTVEDIQRRGEKVLNVAQELYEYGINGKEKYEKPEIFIKEKGNPSTECIGDVEYYVQEYIISTNKDLKSYELYLKNFPEGTVILNSNNEEISNSNPNKIKIAIPISKIVQDIKGTIYIQNANIKTNPIFYCKSTEEGAQSYVTFNNLYEVANTEIDMLVNANTSNLLIRKVDEESDVPLTNVRFEILDSNKNKITEAITDEEGEILIEGLYPQKIYIKEIETQSGYILNTEEKEVILEYDKTTEVEFTNEKQKGKIKIIKEDSENKNIKLENVEFEIRNSDNQVVEKVITNKDGIAISSYLPIGKYKIHEIATNEEYILSDIEEEIEIEYNKTKVINIKNEAKKSKVKIIKIDKDNKELKLSGVEFEILDEKNKVIDKIITNENGEAITKNFCIKDYKIIKIKEVKTLDEYVLNEEIKVIKLEADKVIEVLFENEKKKQPSVKEEEEVEIPKLPRTGC